MGRYPLVYQSIKLTLNYYRRLTIMKPGSLVYAALQEQKSLNLPWFRNIESLLQIDDLYNQDHVTAFHTIKGNKKYHREYTSRASKNILKQLSLLRTAKPIPSKKFRTEHVLQRLKDHFKGCWNNEKSKSTKLSLFYHPAKSSFTKEPYLDHVNNASFRFRTTRLRISAHDLEIEIGRYHKIPREKRICKWCNLTLGNAEIENEHHMLFVCDLYANLRKKLISILNKTPFNDHQETQINAFAAISLGSLHSSFIKLQSPPKAVELDDVELDPLYYHFSDTKNDPTIISTTDHIEHTKKIRSYIHNALASFVGRCFDKRWAFLKELEHSDQKATATVKQSACGKSRATNKTDLKPP